MPTARSPPNVFASCPENKWKMCKSRQCIATRLISENLFGAIGNMIGGADPGEGNVISANGELGIFDDSIIHETFYPEITLNGDLIYKELMESCGRSFNGNFLGFDKLEINFQYSCGIGIYSEYNVTGIRKRY